METIYYGHVPLVRDWQPSEGCLRAALRASQGDRNNIPNTIKKYKFHITKTEFYRFIMELEKFNINLKKIKAIIN